MSVPRVRDNNVLYVFIDVNSALIYGFNLRKDIT